MSFQRSLSSLFATVCVLITPAIQAVDLVGYLPHYRMNAGYTSNVLPGQLAMLDEVRYFGLTVDSNGVIVPVSGSLQSHLNHIATISGLIDGLPEASRPRLGITLGGASQDLTFTNVSVNAAKRDLFAQNIASLLDSTGAVGVDINWEHPNAGSQRTVHYPAMLQRIKQEVGADRSVMATVAPSVMVPSTVFGGANGIDGVSLMTYDMGWWSNDPSNPNTGEHSLASDVAEAVEAWTEPVGSPNDRPWVFGTWGNATPADLVGVGLPFYGRTLSNQTAYTYGELVSGGTTTDGEYYQYRGQQVWAPSPELAAERVAYATEQGLDHIIIWEIAQDVAPTSDASLLKAAFDAKQALVAAPGDFNGDGRVDNGDLNLLLAGWGATSVPADWVNGFEAPVDNAELNALLGGWGAGVTAIPEPTTYLLATACGVLVPCGWTPRCTKSARIR